MFTGPRTLGDALGFLRPAATVVATFATRDVRFIIR